MALTVERNNYTRVPTSCGSLCITGIDYLAKDRHTCNFRSILKDGGVLPMLPYEMIKVKVDRPVGNWYHPNGNTYTGTPQCCWGVEVGTGFSTSDRDKVNARAVKNLYNKFDQFDIDLSVTLAEMPKTLDLIYQSATTFTNLILDLKKLDVRGAFQSLGLDPKGSVFKSLSKTAKGIDKEDTKAVGDFLADSFLQCKYGWMPLVNDVYAAAQLTAELLNRTNVPDVIVKAGSLSSKSLSIQNESNYPSLKYSASGEQLYSVSYTYHAKVIDDALRVTSALGFTNPLPAIWELIPYSFVADWFLPVGNYLAALSAADGFEIIQGCKTEFESRNGFVHLDEIYDMKLVGMYEFVDYVHMKRTVSPALPPATDILYLNGLEDALSFSKAIAAIALLWNVSHGKPADF